MANSTRWDFYSNIYNPFLYFAKTMRNRQFALLDQSGFWQTNAMQVYVAGAGTGLDLPYLQTRLAKQSAVKLVDFSSKMLAKAQQLAHKLDHQLQLDFSVGRAELSGLPDNSCDLVILHLVLAVTDQPELLLQEVSRVLKPNGVLSLWDKFLADNASPSYLRQIANKLTLALGTSINLQLTPLLADLPLQIETRTYCHAGLMQQVIIRKKSICS